MNLRSTTNGLPAPSGSFEWRQAPWGDVLVCGELDGVARHFFTGRQLQLRGTSELARADWARVAGALDLTADRLWRMRQVHGCEVFSVVEVGQGEGGVQGDALVTSRVDVGLAVQVADCVPLLLGDPRTGAVAATHAGWRGTAANVAGATVARLVREYGVRPGDLIAAIGPSIGPSCFQVGPDVREAFVEGARMGEGEMASGASGARSGEGEMASGASGARLGEGERVSAALALSASGISPTQAAGWFTRDVGDRFRLDIWRANEDQLVAAGLRREHVHVAGLCTMTHVEHFFSYRREQQGTGRMLGVIRSRGA